MKKKLLTILGLTLIMAFATACGSNDADQTEVTEEVATTEEATAEEATAEEATAEETTTEASDATAEEAGDVVEGQGDVIEDSDVAIFDNNVISFTYDPANFTVTEDEGSVIAVYTGEEIQTTRMNRLIFTELINTDAMEIIKSYAENYGASEDEIVENYLGGEDVKGYAYSTGNIDSDEEGTKICETFYSVPCGDNIIFIDKLTSLENNDMDAENTLEGMLNEILLSFKIVK